MIEIHQKWNTGKSSGWVRPVVCRGLVMPGAQHLDWIPLKLKEVGTTEKAEKGSHFKYVKNKWWGRIYFKFQKLIFFFFFILLFNWIPSASYWSSFVSITDPNHLLMFLLSEYILAYLAHH